MDDITVNYLNEYDFNSFSFINIEPVLQINC